MKHAHDHNLIHRDIKPANILYTHDGIAKILDLGLSKNVGDTEQLYNTQAGVALGATLYHLITGQTPFQGSTASDPKTSAFAVGRSSGSYGFDAQLDQSRRPFIRSLTSG